MRKKISLTLAILAILLVCLQANATSVRTHLIEIDIDDSGYAKIVERFTLKFETIAEASQFRGQAKRNSSSLLAWQADYEFFFPHFGEIAEKIVESSSVTYEDQTKTLVLNYVLANPFSQIKTEEPRQRIWRIPNTNFSAFESAGLIEIPSNTSIIVNLPPTADITVLEPASSIREENNTVFLSSISTSNLQLEYSIQKPLSGTTSIFERLSGFFSSTTLLAAAIVLLAFGAIGFVKRKTISQKIEDYIVNHSQVEPVRPEEEMDLDH